MQTHRQAALGEAGRLLPDAEWWVKADGVDVVPGITESVRKEWSGDVDLNDGSIEQTHEADMKRVKSTQNIGLGHRKRHSLVQQDLVQLELDLTDDVTFLSSGNVLACV